MARNFKSFSTPESWVERFFDRRAHPPVPYQTHHLDHLASAALLAVPTDQFGQQAIITLRTGRVAATPPAASIR